MYVYIYIYIYIYIITPSYSQIVKETLTLLAATRAHLATTVLNTACLVPLVSAMLDSSVPRARASLDQLICRAALATSAWLEATTKPVVLLGHTSLIGSRVIVTSAQLDFSAKHLVICIVSSHNLRWKKRKT